MHCLKNRTNFPYKHNMLFSCYVITPFSDCFKAKLFRYYGKNDNTEREWGYDTLKNWINMATITTEFTTQLQISDKKSYAKIHKFDYNYFHYNLVIIFNIINEYKYSV